MSEYADMMDSGTETVGGPFVLPRQPTEPDLVAKYFKVLSDPARVRVLELLRERGELSVGELTEALARWRWAARTCPITSGACAGAGSCTPGASTAPCITASRTRE